MLKSDILTNIPTSETEDSTFSETELIQVSLRLVAFLITFLFVILAILIFHEGLLIIFLLPLFILIFIGLNNLDHPFILSSIKIQRELSQVRVTEQDEIEVKLIVTNTGTIKTHILEIKDIIPSKNIEVTKGSNLFLIFLKPNETIQLSYSIKAHTVGVFTFSELLLHYRDFLGLYTSELSLTEDDSPGLEKSLSVIPRIEKILKIPFIKTQWLRLYSGYFTSKHSGHDTDFRGIKEFTFGDVLTHINWKATARWQKLLSNEYNWDKSLTTEIILDTLPSNQLVWINQLRAVISLTDFFTRLRNKVGFTAIRTYPDHIKARVGKHQLLAITNYLITHNIEPIEHLNILSERLLQKSAVFDPNAVIFLVSSFLDKAIRDYAIALKNKGFTTIVIIPLSLEKQAKEIEVLDKKFPVDEIIHKLIVDQLLLERIRLRTILKVNNIPFIEWDTSKHFGDLLQSIRHI